jgi:hypothetical protein
MHSDGEPLRLQPAEDRVHVHQLLFGPTGDAARSACDHSRGSWKLQNATSSAVGASKCSCFAVWILHPRHCHELVHAAQK